MIMHTIFILRFRNLTFIFLRELTKDSSPVMYGVHFIKLEPDRGFADNIDLLCT